MDAIANDYTTEITTLTFRLFPNLLTLNTEGNKIYC